MAIIRRRKQSSKGWPYPRGNVDPRRSLVFAIILLQILFLFYSVDTLDEYANGIPGRPVFLTRRLAAAINQDSTRRSTTTVSLPPSTPLGDEMRIGNYRQRQHIQDEAVPLVVGGTDGSGSRAVVATLMQLGVPMIVDDPHTLDMHANKLFGGKGWPPLANMVLPRRLNEYTFESLPQYEQSKVTNEMEILAQVLQERARTIRQNMTQAAESSTMLATNVTYGFKAPITMLLLPLLQAKLFQGGRFKFLHVVRDGRDVALSENQSPVQKFYRQAYPDASQRIYKLQSVAPVFGMQLWNDWNADLLQWEQRQESSNFDYHVVRIEDLMNPETKFETLRVLADFVGSTKTPFELCCQSREAMNDLGKSSKTFTALPPRNTRMTLRGGKKRGKHRRLDDHHEEEVHEVPEFFDDSENRDDYVGTSGSQSFFDAIVGSIFGLSMKNPANLVSEQVKRLKVKASSSTSTVSARYGKWAHLLARRRDISSALHEEGARALSMFGYFPPRQIQNHKDTEFQCDETVVCP